MATQRATREQLSHVVNAELERLGIYASSVLIFPNSELGWTATVMANPDWVVDYQAFADDIVAKLRGQYELKN